MWNGNPTQFSMVGLQLQPGSFRAVQLDRAGRLRAAAAEHFACDPSLPPAEYEQLAKGVLRRLWRGGHFRGHQVVLAVPSHELWVHNVRLPQVPPDELQQVARFEAEERLPYPVDEAELRLILAGDVKQDGAPRHEVILMACRKSAIEQQIRICEGAGLVPQAIDTEAGALLRMQQAVDAEERRTVFLHFGEQLSTVLFAEGDRVLFLKYILVGTNQFDRAIANELELTELEARQLRSSVSQADELDAEDDVHRSVIEAIRSLLETVTNEVEMCLRYCKVTFRGKPVGQMWLSGMGVSSWLADYLAERFGLPVTLCRDSFDASLGIHQSHRGDFPEQLQRFVTTTDESGVKRREYTDGQWAIAQGLSLRDFNLSDHRPALAMLLATGNAAPSAATREQRGPGVSGSPLPAGDAHEQH